MEKYLIIAGLFINCAYIVVNRFVKKIPTSIAIPILIVGICLMLAGIIQMKTA